MSGAVSGAGGGKRISIAGYAGNIKTQYQISKDVTEYEWLLNSSALTKQKADCSDGTQVKIETTTLTERILSTAVPGGTTDTTVGSTAGGSTTSGVQVRNISLPSDSFSVTGQMVIVTYLLPCKLGYLENDNGSYIFEVPANVKEALLAVKGDVNQDRNVTTSDAATAQGIYLEKIQNPSAEMMLAVCLRLSLSTAAFANNAAGISYEAVIDAPNATIYQSDDDHLVIVHVDASEEFTYVPIQSVVDMLGSGIGKRHTRYDCVRYKFTAVCEVTVTERDGDDVWMRGSAVIGGLGSEGMVFTDVTFRNYHYNAVKWAVKSGITNGTTTATFSSNVTTSRAQVVTFLYRSAR